jgi:hypothetical protein
MPLGQRALSIYAEEVVSDAVDKMNENRLENAALRAARDLLLKVQVEKSGHVLWEGNLLDCQENGDEDDDCESMKGEDYFILPVDGADPVPLEEIRELSCSSSGFNSFMEFFDTIQWGDRRFSSVKEDDTVELNLKMNKNCIVVGSLENFAGTIQDMKQMIKDNRLMLMHLWEPVRDVYRDPTTDGAVFRITKVKLAKTAVQTILDQEKIAADTAANDESVKELKKLSETFADDARLQNVLEQQTALLTENILFKASRDVVRSVQVSFPGGLAHGNLDQGRRVPSSIELHNHPGWVVHVPNDQGKISVLDICNMQISLSGFPLENMSRGYALSAQLTPDGRLVRLPYNSYVAAYFTFDKGWDDIELDTILGERHVVDWLREQLAGVNSSIPDYDGPELFMKLICLTLPLPMVYRSLRALGINYDDEEKEDDGEE